MWHQAVILVDKREMLFQGGDMLTFLVLRYIICIAQLGTSRNKPVVWGKKKKEPVKWMKRDPVDAGDSLETQPNDK